MGLPNDCEVILEVFLDLLQISNQVFSHLGRERGVRTNSVGRGDRPCLNQGMWIYRIR